jgi:hypothetical protein
VREQKPTKKKNKTKRGRKKLHVIIDQHLPIRVVGTDDHDDDNDEED